MGKFAAVVKGGFFGQYSGDLASVDPYYYAKEHRIAAQNLSHKRNLEFRAITDTLVASGLGATASLNYYEIEPNVEMGGKRQIVATPIINRPVGSNDVSDVRETLTSLSSDTYTPNPVYNGDRNPLGTR
jgi:hypothetical protein